MSVRTGLLRQQHHTAGRRAALSAWQHLLSASVATIVPFSASHINLSQTAIAICLLWMRMFFAPECEHVLIYQFAFADLRYLDRWMCHVVICFFYCILYKSRSASILHSVYVHFDRYSLPSFSRLLSFHHLFVSRFMHGRFQFYHLAGVRTARRWLLHHRPTISSLSSKRSPISHFSVDHVEFGITACPWSLALCICLLRAGLVRIPWTTIKIQRVNSHGKRFVYWHLAWTTVKRERKLAYYWQM